MANPDPKLASLLKWSIEAANPSPASTAQDGSPSDAPSASAPPLRGPNADALASLFGGPSDAELMRAAVATLQSPDTPLPDKLTAFDNLEQLLESLDNAANLEPLGLWTPLLALLEDKEAEMRRMAAWCVGTAVQNSRASQERALVGGAVPVLVDMASGKGEADEGARKKARYAISSLIRNFQPGVNEVLQVLGDSDAKVNAGDMESVDKLMERLGR